MEGSYEKVRVNFLPLRRGGGETKIREVNITALDAKRVPMSLPSVLNATEGFGRRPNTLSTLTLNQRHARVSNLLRDRAGKHEGPVGIHKNAHT